MIVCSIANCNKKHTAGGYCMTHYQRNRRHGSPEIVLLDGAKLKGSCYICAGKPCGVKKIYFCEKHILPTIKEK